MITSLNTYDFCLDDARTEKGVRMLLVNVTKDIETKVNWLIAHGAQAVQVTFSDNHEECVDATIGFFRVTGDVKQFQ
jgi:hypothetical protein